MKNFIAGCAFIGIAALMASCGSIKRTEKSNLQVKQETTLKVDSETVKVTETKMFGDTLKGNTFLPIVYTKADSTGADSTTVESGGIKLKIKITPKKSASGGVIGNLIDFSAIAKPISTTLTKEDTQANVNATTKTQVKLKTTSETKEKSGFGIAFWMWCLVGLTVLAAAIYFIKPLLKSIK